MRYTIDIRRNSPPVRSRVDTYGGRRILSRSQGGAGESERKQRTETRVGHILILLSRQDDLNRVKRLCVLRGFTCLIQWPLHVGPHSVRPRLTHPLSSARLRRRAGGDYLS